MLPTAPNKSETKHFLPRRHRRRHHHFLVAWMRSPLKIGSVFPSSRFLARALAAQVDMAQPGFVVELGAGTGVVTHELLQAGIANDRLVVIERDPMLHALLAMHFPGVNIICADAAHLGEVFSSLGITEVSAVVSSLPLLSMPRNVRHAIEEQMVVAIGAGGRIVQFTYGPKSPIGRYTLRKHNLTGKRTKTVLANVPPARVWVYSRPQA